MRIPHYWSVGCWKCAGKIFFEMMATPAVCQRIVPRKNVPDNGCLEQQTVNQRAVHSIRCVLTISGRIQNGFLLKSVILL